MQRHARRPRIPTQHGQCLIRLLSYFRVVDHVVPCSHTRSYPGTTEIGHENELKLAVKQYLPLQSAKSNSKLNAVTIIGGHANGFPKELYEPMWDDLYETLNARGQSIRSIWIADIAQQGQSGVLNESLLGNDPNWWDHARDLLNLINLKQKDMPQPVVGVGHSMGASHLAALALLHPSLFQSLILIDPVIQVENPSTSFAPASTYRRDLWPSRKDAATAFAKSKFYQAWDRRVLDKWLEYGLRDLPTELYPSNEPIPDTEVIDHTPPSQDCKLHDEFKDQKASATAPTSSSDIPVTLTTTVAHEITQYLRPLYKLPAEALSNSQSQSSQSLEHYVYPDIDPSTISQEYPFYRSEPVQIFHRLPELRPPTQYIFGATSPLATPPLRRQKMEATGIAVGGSGGAQKGQVEQVVLPTGHMIPFEMPNQCAKAAGQFLVNHLARYQQIRAEWTKVWEVKERRQRAVEVDEDWKKRMPRPERKK